MLTINAFRVNGAIYIPFTLVTTLIFKALLFTFHLHVCKRLLSDKNVFFIYFRFMKIKYEQKIQQEIVRWFRNHYCLSYHNPQQVIFSVPNENQQRLLSTGVMPGVSDLIIVSAEKVIFVEVKSDTGRQSDAQKEFQSRVEALGYQYWLVRSLNDFKTQIAANFIGPS